MRWRGWTTTITKSSCWTTTRPIRRSGSRSRRIARRLGARFRFYPFRRHVKGFKAGALNDALALTDPAAALHRGDRQRLSGRAVLAAPRACRFSPHPRSRWCRGRRIIATRTRISSRRMAYEEYRGFFHIGMVERNEHNAIIQHGTMTIVRKRALEEVDGWSEWCITEDTELGLKLFEAGYERRLYPAEHGHGPDARHAGSLHDPALSLGLWRDADHEAPCRRDLPGPHRALLGAALSVPLRLAALDFRRAGHDRDRSWRWSGPR